MKRLICRCITPLIAFVLFLNLPLVARAAEYKTTFLYSLSDFSGPRPFDGARLSMDRVKQEIYAINRDMVSVFNSTGMEIFRFDQDPAIGSFIDLAFTNDQKMVVLASRGGSVRLVECNFRGELRREIKLQGLPPELANFSPNRIIYSNAKFYLASYNSMQVVITDENGTFIQSFDLVKTLELTEQQRMDTGMGGFAVDDEGTLYFTIPTLAAVYVLKPDGTYRVFGKRGSTAGRFGVNSGIAVDRNGNILVTDKLRSTVIVFDRNFALVTEFGKRGLKPGDLVVPDEIIVDGNNRAYVSNLRKRGVVVYQLSGS